jgi:hypothetical protein
MVSFEASASKAHVGLDTTARNSMSMYEQKSRFLMWACLLAVTSFSLSHLMDQHSVEVTGSSLNNWNLSWHSFQGFNLDLQVSVTPGGRWNKFKTYSTIQRTFEIWSFVATFVVRFLLIKQKWTYRGGMTELKQVRYRRARRKLCCRRNALIGSHPLN